MQISCPIYHNVTVEELKEESGAKYQNLRLHSGGSTAQLHAAPVMSISISDAYSEATGCDRIDISQRRTCAEQTASVKTGAMNGWCKTECQ